MGPSSPGILKCMFEVNFSDRRVRCLGGLLAILGKNDFFPFTREELKTHDPTMFDLLEKQWGLPRTRTSVP